MPDAEADIYLVGLGIGGFERRTVEADDILSQCSAILHLTAFGDELRRRYDADIVDLNGMYQDQDNPTAIYNDMTAVVVKSAHSYLSLGPIAFLTYGHPLYLVDTSWQLLGSDADHGLRVKTVTGISFVDQVLADLGVRFDYAVQIFESSLFCTQNVHVDIRFPLLLSQVGDVHSDVLRPTGDLAARTDSLIRRLQQIYPADRHVAVIRSAWRRDMAPQITVASVQDLHGLASSMQVGVSMYVEGEQPWSALGPR